MRFTRYVLVLVLLARGVAATVLLHPNLNQRGSATIIQQPTAEGTKVIVVDTGDISHQAGRGGEAVLETLQFNGVDHVDLLIITHLDTDHFCGYLSLLKLPGAPSASEMESGKPRGPPILSVVRPVFDRGNPAVVEFTSDMEALGIPIVTPLDTDALAEIQRRFGLNIVAAPNPRNTNASSLVVSINDTEVERGRHIITGDLTRESWNKIAAQVSAERVLSLTAPHHGGDRVLVPMRSKLRPRATIINANQDNQHGHPSLKVMREVALEVYGSTPDLHPYEYSIVQTRLNASADREYLELLQNYYEVEKEAFQLASAAKYAAAVDARNTAELIVLNKRTRNPLSRQLRITGDHGTILQRGAELQGQRTLRDEVLEEAVYRQVARLSNEEIATYKTWSMARTILLIHAESDLYMIREYLAGTPGFTLPAYAAEYVRIVMDLRRLTKDDAPKIRAALQSVARPSKLLLPPMENLVVRPNREPIEELRRTFGKPNERLITPLKSPEEFLEIRLPSEHRPRTQDFLLRSYTEKTWWRVAKLLPQPLWQHDGAWRARSQNNEIARRIVTPEEHFDATLRARGTTPFAEQYKAQVRKARVRPRARR